MLEFTALICLLSHMRNLDRSHPFDQPSSRTFVEHTSIRFPCTSGGAIAFGDQKIGERRSKDWRNDLVLLLRKVGLGMTEFGSDLKVHVT
jgi:hypothetical protein